MNKTQKILGSLIVLALMAFSSALMPANALLNNSTLSIAGSSTVYPIAESAAATFPAYWNSIAANYGGTQISSINLAGLGSGTAIPAICATKGGNPTADIGEMSRPPNDASSEWNSANCTTLQIWAVGVDSLAIVYSKDMTWAPTNLNFVQVAKLFESSDAAGTSPFYTTWGQFLTDYYGAGNIPTAAQSHMSDPINRVVRDPTSGTYDCFDNFFGKGVAPGVSDVEQKDSAGNVLGSQYMAPYQKAPANQDVVNDVAATSDCIAFISLGYYTKNTATEIGLNLQCVPNGAYYAPTQANVIAGTYTPYRWLWEVTPNVIPSTGPNLVEGVWIAYMKLDANIINGNPNFVTSNDYMAMPRAAMAGGTTLNGALTAHTPLLSGQTQTVPRLTVDANDFFYFTDAYIAYYANHVYNPYADITAQGKIDSSSFLAFLSEYVYYFTTYAPTHSGA